MCLWPSVLSLWLVKTIKGDVCQIYSSCSCVSLGLHMYACGFYSEQMWASATAAKAINTCLEVFACLLLQLLLFDALWLYVLCLSKLSDIPVFKHAFNFHAHNERWALCFGNVSYHQGQYSPVSAVKDVRLTCRFTYRTIQSKLQLMEWFQSKQFHLIQNLDLNPNKNLLQ